MKFFFIKVFYISTLITFSQKAIAQKADTTSTKNKQDGYNIKYRQPLDSLMMLGLSFMADNTLFHLPTIHGGKSFDILPNMAPPLKLSFRYKSLGLSVSGLRFLLYGTGYKSFNIDWTPTKNLSFYYQYGSAKNYRLDSLENYTKYLINPKNENVSFPNIKTTFFKGQNYYYSNGNKFANRLPDQYYEKQKKSAGSWVIPFSFFYTKIDLSSEKFKDFTQPGSLGLPYNLSDFSVVTGIGYTYNWMIFRRFLVNFREIPLLGLNYNHANYDNNMHVNNLAFTFGTQTDFVFAYVSKNWIFSERVQGISGQDLSTQKRLITTHIFTEVSIAHTFGVPKFLKKRKR